MFSRRFSVSRGLLMLLLLGLMSIVLHDCPTGVKALLLSIALWRLLSVSLRRLLLSIALRSLLLTISLLLLSIVALWLLLLRVESQLSKCAVKSSGLSIALLLLLGIVLRLLTIPSLLWRLLLLRLSRGHTLKLHGGPSELIVGLLLLLWRHLLLWL